jgi:hypothetical protein
MLLILITSARKKVMKFQFIWENHDAASTPPPGQPQFELRECRRQSYKQNLALKKSKLVLNFWTGRYFTYSLLGFK